MLIKKYLHLLMLTVLCLTPTLKAQDIENQFKLLTVFDGLETRNYTLFVPIKYTEKKSWPVIVFLHGTGERGNDGKIPTQVGLGQAIRAHPERFPCLVVFPQAHLQFLHAPVQVDTWEGQDETAILNALDDTLTRWHGDRERVYLTGLSMGGIGTWAVGSRHPELFAALMPISSSYYKLRLENITKSLVKKPIWIFHGAKDSAIAPRWSQEIYQALTLAGSTQSRMTLYPSLPHNAWDATYRSEEAIQWLLEQRL